MYGSNKVTVTPAELSERDQAEVARSAAEAAGALLKPVPHSQIRRYLDPSENTPYILEYAFYLLGDVRGKDVLDLGCGKGENLISLIERGARVTGIDVAPGMVAISQSRIHQVRLCEAGSQALVRVGSAYETGFPDESFDVIFCMGVLHHLDITTAREEMWRILRPSGVIVLKEPIRFSKAYAWLRSFLPAGKDISPYEHPLTREELASMVGRFRVSGIRHSRLPFVPLITVLFPSTQAATLRVSHWILQRCRWLEIFATTIAMKLEQGDALIGVESCSDEDDILLTTAQGQWFHVDMNIRAGDATYQAAVDVNEVSGNFQYPIFNNLDLSLFAPISALSEGWHLLAPNATSGAMDYKRSPILQRPLGCLAIFWTIWNAIFPSLVTVYRHL